LGVETLGWAKSCSYNYYLWKKYSNLELPLGEEEKVAIRNCSFEIKGREIERFKK
jgi:hypothetical protein